MTEYERGFIDGRNAAVEIIREANEFHKLTALSADTSIMMLKPKKSKGRGNGK